MASIGSAEVLVAISTLLGPVLAVQAQKAVERAAQRGQRQKQVFETLMSTFATRIAPEHVQALNLIELAFRPPSGIRRLFYLKKKKDEKVLEAWRTYAVNLFTERRDMSEEQLIAHGREGDRLFKDLMYVMSDRLDYGLTRDVLAKGTYHPVGNVEREQAIIKFIDFASKVFANERNLSMDIKTFPVSQEALDLQMRVQQALLDLSRDRRLHVEIERGEPASSE